MLDVASESAIDSNAQAVATRIDDIPRVHLGCLVGVDELLHHAMRLEPWIELLLLLRLLRPVAHPAGPFSSPDACAVTLTPPRQAVKRPSDHLTRRLRVSRRRRRQTSTESLEAVVQIREPVPKQVCIDPARPYLSLDRAAEAAERELYLLDLGRSLAHRRLGRQRIELPGDPVEVRRHVAQHPRPIALRAHRQHGGLVMERHRARVRIERATVGVGCRRFARPASKQYATIPAITTRASRSQGHHVVEDESEDADEELAAAFDPGGVDVAVDEDVDVSVAVDVEVEVESRLGGGRRLRSG